MWQTQAKDGEGRGGKCDREKGEGSSVSFPPLPSPFLPFCPTLLTPAMQGNNIVHILLITSQSSSVPLACSKRSDSGERCRVKKAMKTRAFIFSRSFLLRTAPHYLNAWNRLAYPSLLLFFGFAFDFNLATQNTGASMQNVSF